ncbi:hypothetical protein NPIL_360651 [Nephila pilipes]|uniref:Uncharacterized protein n=1 Tax=Nephila pilipes TaxID=299642 RepID=A0A8X6PGI0_NEPPI|nr:hypothetical protein NPIL_360651 [Nephila pilipes]
MHDRRTKNGSRSVLHSLNHFRVQQRNIALQLKDSGHVLLFHTCPLPLLLLECMAAKNLIGTKTNRPSRFISLPLASEKSRQFCAVGLRRDFDINQKAKVRRKNRWGKTKSNRHSELWRKI